MTRKAALSRSTILLGSVARAVTAAGFSIEGQVDLPARAPTYAPPPASLHAAVHDAIARQYPQGLYSHQALALAASVAGADICVATPTASGKSLVFMAAAADAVLRDPNARVLVLYPARALIHDQCDKWAALLGGLGISHAFIDGSVAMDRRLSLLQSSRVVMMTPDVAHAWLLARQGERVVRAFLDGLRIVILDEAHVYEGVFGTNMAYFLRRLAVSAGAHRLIAATATVEDPRGFLAKLTGRSMRVIGPADDGAPSPARSIVHVTGGRGFTSMAALVAGLARGTERFLAFADSRRMVEQIVAASQRDDHTITGAEDGAEAEDGPTPSTAGHLPVLPYRSGYESDDRTAIQRALAQGSLSGVVATSAMELGVDIGEINLVVMLGVPGTAKAFRQRLGRAGRRSDSVCILVDSGAALRRCPEALATWLDRPMEPSWLYLENRYLQYANALCAAAEARIHGRGPDAPAFADLPETFRALLANEIDPHAAIAEDLYPLKQRGDAGPHLEFPIRHGTERSYQITEHNGAGLGNVTFSQVLREAYPGAVYYYMARPFRIRHFDHRNGRIQAARDAHRITRPIRQSMVFPSFQGMHQLRMGTEGFVAEVPVQVSERVLGFSERRGQQSVEHRYGPGSAYYPREISNFFTTTGVCWAFPGTNTGGEAAARWILQAFCQTFGVHDGDVGLGTFHARTSPLGAGVCQGLCLFDATHGSLRLTQRLVEKMDEVLAFAISLAEFDGDARAADGLTALAALVASATGQVVDPGGAVGAPVITTSDDWIDVVAEGEQAMLSTSDGARQVTVIRHRYTPRGLLYDLVPVRDESLWSVNAATVQPIHGITRTVQVNLVTGETR